MDGESFRFLFRQSEGTIGAALWRRWTLALTGLGLAGALLWVALSPWLQRDLSVQGLFDLRAVIASVYLLLFTLLLVVTQISQMNLSAKRFRAISVNSALASLWPLAAFGAAAGFWVQPNLFGLAPDFAPWLIVATALGVFGWQFWLLGRDA